MKKQCLIICMLIAAACVATANNNAVSNSSKLTETERTITNFDCKNCLLSFEKESKVVISDAKGHVVFYNEKVQLLDMSAWEHGSYVVTVNDEETFDFTL